MRTPTLPLFAVAVLLVAPWSGIAQESAAQRHEMATNHLKQVAIRMSSDCLNEIRTLDDWRKSRTEWRRQLLDMLGLNPLPRRTPLQAQITGRLERPEYRIEKVVFQSLPGLYVTGNFYVPKSAGQPVPVILYLCGHSPHPLGAKFNYQDRAIWFATHGFACLILDTLEFGEVAGSHHGTHDLNRWHWLSLGYTPAGTEVWNAMRAIDYLETRREVDAGRIGLTGISGGGAITWYTAAVDERVTAAAPVCSTFTFGSQARGWLASGQCDCIYYHNTFGLDFPVVGALIAPRPLLMISGQKDTIFPPDGYHEVFQRTKRIYDLHGAQVSEQIREVDDAVGHSDPPLFLREARQWMQRWLKNDPTPLPIETNRPPTETAEDLACLTTLPSKALNFRIQDFLTGPISRGAGDAGLASGAEGQGTGRTSLFGRRNAAAQEARQLNSILEERRLPMPESRSAWGRRRTELLGQLKDRVFRWFPNTNIPFETKISRNSGGWIPRYSDYKEVSFQTEEGVRVRAQLLTPRTLPALRPLVIYVKRAEESLYFMDMDELLPVLGRYTVLILNPRWTEKPLSVAEFADVERTAVWTGRTIAAMQIWDILRAVRWAVEEEKIPATSISVYGRGETGILALYAGLFDERVQQVILDGAPASHWEGPALLNVLRVTDLPEVAGAFAPRRLTSLTKLPESFSHTRRLYRLQGAAARFSQSGSLPEALALER